MKIHLGAVFEEFIGDFIKDEAGTWWLVNVKGYLLKPESPQSFDQKLITNYGEEEVQILKKKVMFW